MRKLLNIWIAGEDIKDRMKRKGSVNQGEGDPLQKKIKCEDALDGVSESNLMKKQNEEFYELLDLLEKHTKKEDWIEILKLNKQAIPFEGTREVSVSIWNEKFYS